jgi:hypothetical protein
MANELSLAVELASWTSRGWSVVSGSLYESSVSQVRLGAVPAGTSPRARRQQ